MRIGSDHKPSGPVLLTVPSTGQGIPKAIMDLWTPGQVAVCWGCDLPLPRRLPEASLASVRQKRLRRRLESSFPLLANELERSELKNRPAFYAGKDEPTRPDGKGIEASEPGIV